MDSLWLASAEWAFSACTCSQVVKQAEEDEQPEEEPFLGSELAVAAILAAAFSVAGVAILEKFEDFFKQDQPRTRDFMLLLEEAKPLAANVLTEEALGGILAEIENVLREGSVYGVGGYVLAGVPTLDVVKEGILQSTKYYSNTYFNRIVVPQIESAVEKIVTSGTLATNADFRKIQTLMDARLKATPYWRVVANASMSRGFHYGALKAAQMTGRTGYRLVAVLDDKTSEICRELDGKTFWVADAVQLIERLAVSDPEEVKNISPWLKLDEIKGKTTDELRSLGVLVPPFHGSCRTTLVLV